MKGKVFRVQFWWVVASLICGLLLGCIRRPAQPKGTLRLQPSRINATTSVRAILRMPGGAPDSLRILWFRDGSLVGQGETLPPGRVRRGDTLRALALFFYKGVVESLWSSPVPVTNSPPVIRSLRVRPDPPHPDSTLRAGAEVWDPDGDPVQLDFHWEVNGREVSRDTLLPPGTFRGGDRVTLRVVPKDPVEAGEATVYEGIALNRPPRFLTTGRPTRKGDTLLIPIRAEDPDGDSLTLELVEAPPGFHLDPRRGVVWGILRGGAVIRVEARDPHGGRAWYRIDLEEVP